MVWPILTVWEDIVREYAAGDSGFQYSYGSPSLPPDVIKANLRLQQLDAVGQKTGSIAEKQVQQGAPLLGRPGQFRLPFNAHRLRGVFYGRSEISDLINQMQRQGLIPGPHSPISDGLYVLHFQVPAVSHRMDELGVHVIQQALKV